VRRQYSFPVYSIQFTTMDSLVAVLAVAAAAHVVAACFWVAEYAVTVVAAKRKAAR
jgi:hypothetical protein